MPAGAHAVLFALLLAGCGAQGGTPPQDDRGDAVDRNDATPVAMPFGEPALPPPEAGNATDAPAAGELPAEPDAAAARATVIGYLDALARDDDAAAVAAWEPGSDASRGKLERELARYRDYRREVGAPGRVDAGAGQRFVEVPASARARRSDGSAVRLAGTFVLHRSGAIDGASAEQRRWRIREVRIATP